MIGHSSLWKIVGTNTFGAITTTDQGLALGGLFLFLFLLFGIVNSGLQQ